MNIATPTDVTVVIVGAGPVGASLGLALAGRDISTCVIEAGPAGAPGDDERGLALSLASLRILAALGLGPTLRRAGHGIRSILVTDQGGPGVVELHADDADLPALGGVLTAAVLQQALNAAVAALGPRLPVHYDSAVETIRIDTDHARVSVRGPTGGRELTARLVVLADGGRSDLRERLGFAIERHDFREHILVTHATASHHPGDRALELLTRSGPLAVLPRLEGRVTLVRCLGETEARRAKSLADADWLAELGAPLRGRLGVLTEPSPRSAYPLVRSRARPACRERLLLLGAAERTLHPNGAQGFNLGLRDVAGLCDVLEDSQRRGGDPGALATLERYLSERRADQAAVGQFSSGLHAVAGLQFPGAGLLRGVGMLGLTLCRGLRRQLILQTAGLRGRQSRLLRAARTLWPATAGRAE